VKSIYRLLDCNSFVSFGNKNVSNKSERINPMLTRYAHVSASPGNYRYAYVDETDGNACVVNA
jgi:hypothetical protein